MKAIVERYAAIQRDLSLPQEIVTEIEQDLWARVKSEKSHHGMFRDCMKAAGDNAAKIVAQAFQARGANAVYVNPHEAACFLTSDFGNARPWRSPIRAEAYALQPYGTGGFSWFLWLYQIRSGRHFSAWRL